MITIEFLKKAPKSLDNEERVLVFPETTLVKQHEPIREVFYQKNLHQENLYQENLYQDSSRKLFIQEGKTRQTRENLGALLYNKLSNNCSTVVLDINNKDVVDYVTGMLLANWRFDKYRTSFRPDEVCYLEKIIVLTEEPDVLQKAYARTKAVIDGVLFARELTSEPSNCLYPLAYAERLLELREYGIEVEILDEQALKALGMKAILAVGQGSDHASCVVCLRWTGTSKQGTTSQDRPIVLAGKGVCFDSGGLCIKPAKDQQVMKWDKAGAGVVAGVLKALALSKSPSFVVGIVGLVENMPDGKALKPGDVIKTMSGQTIEVVDTDAEGRLVLADCLWYAQERFNPKSLIDLGTLTQETFATLGSAYAGLYADNTELANDLIQAGSKSNDALWRLPMGEYFAKQLESSVADMKNLGEEHWGENGAAAEFLKRFIKADFKNWAHIDIAGVSWTSNDVPLCKKGPTGYGVRLLEEWIYSMESL